MVVRIAHSEADIETCFRIRQEVFVGEQSVPLELEQDEFDPRAFHFLVEDDGRPIAVARAVLMDQGATAKIGRVAVVKSRRGDGKFLIEAIEGSPRLAQVTKFALDAQTYAIRFYERLGYEAYGHEFLDAGILHQHMIKRRAPIRAA
jgi:predicted GNAT family N-acyltransferase